MRSDRKRFPEIALACAVLTTAPEGVFAQVQTGFGGYNSYGYPGLIDMPSALNRPDAELALTSSYFRNQTRNTLTFQISPRLSGSFRYSSLHNIRPYPSSQVVDYRFDRSFSLHYQIRDEARVWPALAIGLNDFLGTGMYASEYVVATKTVSPRLRVTGGLGWGRLAGVGSFRNPLSHLSDTFDTRPGRASGDQGGNVSTNAWFRGPAAFFGGVEWQASDKLSFAAEYSSDAYPNEDGTAFARRSPFNFGATYRVSQNLSLDLRYLYGSEFGVGLTLALNPRRPQSGAGTGPAPTPVTPRSAATAEALGWTVEKTGADTLRHRVRAGLADEGLRLHALSLTARTIRVEFENPTYPNHAQAIGRAARRLTGLLPHAVETVTLVPITSGLTGAAVTLKRADIEALEHDVDGSLKSWQRAQIAPATRLTATHANQDPQFHWGLKPYLSTSLFDPEDPLRADIGAELFARFEPTPGLVLAGVLRKPVLGNLDSSTRPSTSALPHVRSDFNIYEREGDPALTELTLAYFFQPSRSVYGRVTGGYLEPMFAGISAEVLWKPIDSRIALGAELNHVFQRDFDQDFGLRDYGVTTGHASAYWDMGNGFHAQLDAGRYLAGDWGATLALDREFHNGWKVGGFATFTNVSATDFGEGSFDKGLRFTIPLAWVSGKPRQDSYQTVIRPVTRDGGARLDVPERLYETVRGTHLAGLEFGWGRFWK